MSLAPIDLGVPPGCSDFYPRAVNNGAFPRGLVVTGTANCSSGSKAYTWHDGTWQSFDAPSPYSPAEGFNGYLTSIADDHPTTPTMILVASDDFRDEVWTTSYGQAPAALPVPRLYHLVSALVSSRGDYAVGALMYEPGNLGVQAVRWARDPQGWSEPEVIAHGRPTALSADGNVVAGNDYSIELSAWVWSATAEDIILLGPESRVNGVTDDGTLIVGSRRVPCIQRQCNVASRAVYWTPTGSYGSWVAHELQLPDSLDADSWVEAAAIADIGGADVIVGTAWAVWQGEIIHSLAWFPLADGGYGEPLMLETLDGDGFYDAGVTDINRNGVAVGWAGGPFASARGVLWQLVDPQAAAINAGHAGAWFDPATAGQGVLLDVDPSDQSLFLGWFTFTPPGSSEPGEPHWYTAQGHYEGSGAELTVYEARGGQFNQPPAAISSAVGTLAVSFGGCGHGQVSYALDWPGVQGGFAIQRLLPGSDSACRQLANSATESVDLNPAMSGAWFDPSTPGQGVLLDVRPGPAGGNFLFLGWFTWGDGTATGQRWLTAQGPFAGSQAELEVHETLGGVLNRASAVDTHAVGELSLDFSDCNNASLSYSLDGRDGMAPLTRLFPARKALCEGWSGLQ